MKPQAMRRSGGDLTVGPIGRQLAALTVPMFLGISSMIAASMVDTVYIGWIGTLELAAVSFTFPLVMAASSISMGLGIGATSIMSRTLGGGDREHCLTIGTHTLALVTAFIVAIAAAGYVFAEPIFVALGADEEILPMTVSYTRIWFIGLPFFALPMVGGMMLRALGDARTPGIWMTASAALQVLIAPVAIFGIGSWDGLGLLGSAWAFNLSRVVILVFAVPTFRRVGLFRPLGGLASLWTSWREVLRIGVPSMATNLIGPASMSFLLALLASHGHAVVAAFGVATRIESLAMMLLMALSSSVAPFAGQNFGAGEVGRIREALRLTYRFSIAWGIAVFVLLASCGAPIASFVNDDPNVIAATWHYLVIVPLTFGFMGVGMMASSCFLALGQPLPSLILSIARSFALLVPLALLLDAVWGYLGIYGAIAAANLIMSVVAAWWIRRSLRRADRRF